MSTKPTAVTWRLFLSERGCKSLYNGVNAVKDSVPGQWIVETCRAHCSVPTAFAACGSLAQILAVSTAAALPGGSLPDLLPAGSTHTIPEDCICRGPALTNALLAVTHIAVGLQARAQAAGHSPPDLAAALLSTTEVATSSVRAMTQQLHVVCMKLMAAAPSVATRTAAQLCWACVMLARSASAGSTLQHANAASAQELAYALAAPQAPTFVAASSLALDGGLVLAHVASTLLKASGESRLSRLLAQDPVVQQGALSALEPLLAFCVREMHASLGKQRGLARRSSPGTPPGDTDGWATWAWGQAESAAVAVGAWIAGELGDAGDGSQRRGGKSGAAAPEKWIARTSLRGVVAGVLLAAAQHVAHPTAHAQLIGRASASTSASLGARRLPASVRDVVAMCSGALSHAWGAAPLAACTLAALCSSEPGRRSPQVPSTSASPALHSALEEQRAAVAEPALPTTIMDLLVDPHIQPRSCYTTLWLPRPAAAVHVPYLGTVARAALAGMRTFTRAPPGMPQPRRRATQSITAVECCVVLASCAHVLHVALRHVHARARPVARPRGSSSIASTPAFSGSQPDRTPSAPQQSGVTLQLPSAPAPGYGAALWSRASAAVSSAAATVSALRPGAVQPSTQPASTTVRAPVSSAASQPEPSPSAPSSALSPPPAPTAALDAIGAAVASALPLAEMAEAACALLGSADTVGWLAHAAAHERFASGRVEDTALLHASSVVVLAAMLPCSQRAEVWAALLPWHTRLATWVGTVRKCSASTSAALSTAAEQLAALLAVCQELSVMGGLPRLGSTTPADASVVLARVEAAAPWAHVSSKWTHLIRAPALPLAVQEDAAHFACRELLTQLHAAYQ